MWKVRLIGFCLLIVASIYCNGQSNKTTTPQFTDVKIRGYDGAVNNSCFDWLGKSKCFELLEEFEKVLSNTGNKYGDYCRYYYIMRPKPDKLWITLIPKKLMEITEKTKEPIPLNSKFLEVSYDVKTKKISKPVTTGPKIIM